MKEAKNSTVLVSVTNTVARYSNNEISIKGKINIFGEPYSHAIHKGQDVIIISRRKRWAYKASYKATRHGGKLHIFQIYNVYRIPQSAAIPETYNGFKKVAGNDQSLIESLEGVLVKLGGSAQVKAPQTPVSTAPVISASVDSYVFQSKLCQTIKRQYDDLKVLGIGSDKILDHLDSLLGHMLTMPLNPSLTDSPLSLYSASLIREVNCDDLIPEIKEQLSESQYFDFEYKYVKGIRYEGTSKKQAMLDAVAFLNDATFEEWLLSRLNPVRNNVSTRELIEAISMHGYDWSVAPVAHAA